MNHSHNFGIGSYHYGQFRFPGALTFGSRLTEPKSASSQLFRNLHRAFTLLHRLAPCGHSLPRNLEIIEDCPCGPYYYAGRGRGYSRWAGHFTSDAQSCSNVYQRGPGLVVPPVVCSGLKTFKSVAIFTVAVSYRTIAH